MAEALRMPDVEPSACTALGATPVGSTPDETRVFLRQETERWRKVIRKRASSCSEPALASWDARSLA